MVPSRSESATKRRARRECISPDGPPRPISGRSQVGDSERPVVEAPAHAFVAKRKPALAAQPPRDC
jgi:hypothetical protein